MSEAELAQLMKKVNQLPKRFFPNPITGCVEGFFSSKEVIELLNNLEEKDNK